MKRLLGHFAVLLVLTWAGLASAQSAADRTTARRLGKEGQIALNKGDFDTAADRFQRANELIPAPSFLVRLARARVGQGRLVEAHEIYKKIIRDGVAPDKPKAFHRALAEAKEEVKEVEPRLAWVTVSVGGALPEGAKVTLNGAELPKAALGVRRPVDPGRVIAKVTAPGYRPDESAPILLDEGQRGPSIELELVPLPKPKVAQVQPPDMTMDGGEPVGFTQSTLGYVALGIGGLSLAASGVSALLAVRARENGPPCTPGAGNDCVVFYDPRDQAELDSLTNQAKSAEDDYTKFADTATVTLIAGSVFATTGLILLLTDTGPDEEASAHITPFVGWGTIGATGRF